MNGTALNIATFFEQMCGYLREIAEDILDAHYAKNEDREDKGFACLAFIGLDMDESFELLDAVTTPAIRCW